MLTLYVTNADDIKDDIKEDIKEVIMRLLRKDSSLTYKELAAQTGKSVASISRIISKMKGSDIKRIGGRKDGYWEIIDKK